MLTHKPLASKNGLSMPHMCCAAGMPALNGLSLGAADRPGLGAAPAADADADGSARGGLGLGANPGLGATAGLGASDAPAAGLGGFTRAGLGSYGSETPGARCFM